MTTLIFASRNKSKLSEIQAVLPASVGLLSLDDIHFTEDIPEPFDSFEENALTKAQTIHRLTQSNVFSEDSGLIIPALGGQPGVHSARYAGAHKSDLDNLHKVLEEMKGLTDRRAHYLSHICLVWDTDVYHFEGKCHGRIAGEPSGTGGFGYDPIFIPEHYDQTLGELDPSIKLALSHRSIALNQMISWLKDHTKN